MGAAPFHFGGAVLPESTQTIVRGGRLQVVQRAGAVGRTIRFDALAPARRDYVRARARGYGLAAACTGLGLPQETARRWELAPWYVAALDECRLHIADEKVAMLVAGLPDAVERLTRIVREGADPVALQAATYLIDQVFGKPTTRTESHSRSEVAVVSPDDVLRALDRLNGLGVAIDGDYQTVPVEDVE
jgi:hypothetical protein